MGDSAWLWCW